MPLKKRSTRRRRTNRRLHRRTKTRVNTRRHRGGMGFQEPKNEEVIVTMKGTTMTKKEYNNHMEGLGSSTDSGL